MATPPQAVESNPFQEEYDWLLSLPENERTEYVRKTLISISSSIQNIKKDKNPVKLARNAGKLMDELNAKATQLLPPLIYAVKPEFQDLFCQFLTSLADNLADMGGVKK